MYLKSHFLFHLFLNLKKKSDLNLNFLIKHHLEEIGEGIIKKFDKIIIGKTFLDRNAIYYFYQNWFLLVLTCWKRNTFQISMKLHLKKRKIIFENFFSSSFDVLHSSPIVHMDHTELIILDLLLYCTKKVPENNFCHGQDPKDRPWPSGTLFLLLVVGFQAWHEDPQYFYIFWTPYKMTIRGAD